MAEKNTKETRNYKLYLVLTTIVDLNITQLKKRCILIWNKNRNYLENRFIIVCTKYYIEIGI